LSITYTCKYTGWFTEKVLLTKKESAVEAVSFFGPTCVCYLMNNL